MVTPAACCSGLAVGSSTEMIGPASSASSTASGVRMIRVQVSRADAVRRTASVSPAAIGPASSGTTRPAMAPPATISKMMLGMAEAAL